jgi:hypothetical protein
LDEKWQSHVVAGRGSLRGERIALPDPSVAPRERIGPLSAE